VKHDAISSSRVRLSGTEDVCKLYAESFRGREHLRRIEEEAQALITRAMAAVMG
jgi:phosphoglucomutase